MQLPEFFQHLWDQYTAVTPQARRIFDAVAATNGFIVNDHVAFRTFRHAPLDIAHLQPLLEQLGYVPFDRYQFRQKKLEAVAFRHADPLQPKIFLSELLLDQLSERARAILLGRLNFAELPVPRDPSFFWQGVLWPRITFAEYQQLLQESEYAAWLMVMGYCANHFTISVNHLARTPSLDAVIEAVQALGLPLNESGGLIKGCASVGLQQASTLADEMDYTFADGETHKVKTCYYEFALRYPLMNGTSTSGELYQGFVEQSADRIFESTFNQRTG